MKLLVTKILLFLLISSVSETKEYQLDKFDLSINVPLKFTLTDDFDGFEQAETFSTIKVDEIRDSFDAVSSTVLAAGETSEYKRLTVSELPGMILTKQIRIYEIEFEKQVLLFGDSFSTIIVEASYPVNFSQRLSHVIESTLLSIKWLRSADEQIFSGLPFTLKQGKNLTFSKRTANSIVFIDKAPYDTEKSLTPLFVVSWVNIENKLSDIIEFSKQQLANHRFESNIDIKKAYEKTVDGIRAYHIEAIAIEKKSGHSVFLYQTIVIQPKKFLLAIGAVKVGQINHFKPQFAAIVDSIKFKEIK